MALFFGHKIFVFFRLNASLLDRRHFLDSLLAVADADVECAALDDFPLELLAEDDVDDEEDDDVPPPLVLAAWLRLLLV